jgi:hypothetical protein
MPLPLMEGGVESNATSHCAFHISMLKRPHWDHAQRRGAQSGFVLLNLFEERRTWSSKL